MKKSAAVHLTLMASMAAAAACRQTPERRCVARGGFGESAGAHAGGQGTGASGAHGGGAGE